MLKTLELNNFVVAARSGSFAQASAELGISQPALSKSISKLERSLGVRLFERNARGVVPTVYGESLLRRAVPVLADLESAVQDIDALRGGQGGVVSIGAAPAVTADFVPSLFKNLRQSQQAVRLRVVEGLVEDLVAGVRAGKLDLAITTNAGPESPPELLAQPLFEDTFVVCCAVNHPLARTRNPRPADMAQATWVLAPRDGILRFELDRKFRRLGLEPPDSLVETASGALSKILVMEHGCLSFLPREMISFEERKGYMSVLHAPMLEWTRQISVFTRRGRTLTSSAALVIDIISQVAAARSGQPAQRRGQ